MKKMMKRILSLAVVSVMLVLLTACGEQDKFIGSWEAEVNMAEYIMKSMVEEDAEVAEYFDIEDFTLVLQMTFNSDGTYTKGIDMEAAKEAFAGLQKDFENGVTKYLEDVIKTSGLDMSVEDVLEASGTTLDEMVEESFGSSVLVELAEEMKSGGNFEVKEGKLYLSDGEENTIDENVYETYEISKDELKLLESIGSEDEDDVEELYPLIFKRVK